jgi:hypothetical protein
MFRVGIRQGHFSGPNGDFSGVDANRAEPYGGFVATDKARMTRIPNRIATLDASNLDLHPFLYAFVRLSGSH